MSLAISCPDCRSSISASDLNMETMVARCFKCNSLFDATRQLKGEGSVSGSAGPSAPAVRPKAPQPKSVKQESWGSRFTLTRKWFSPAALFLAFFCLFWDGFLVFWYAAVLSADKIEWIAVLFPLGHLAVGVGLTYSVVASFLNSTTFTVNGGLFSVKHGPVPWSGNLELAVREIDQFFVVEKVSSKGNRSYELCALKTDNTKICVASSLNSSDEAVFLEQALEEHLNIEDREVSGQFT